MTGKLCCRNERAEEQSLFRRCPSLLSLTLMSVLLSPLSLQAADIRRSGEDTFIIQQQRQEALEQQLTPSAPDVRLSVPGSFAHKINFPVETPCFQIKQTELKGADALPHWLPLQKIANGAVGHCLGAKGINLLMSTLQNRLVDHGYVTTRVLAPSQDLKSGILRLVIIPGVVRHVRLTPGSDDYIQLYSSFPAHEGSLLDLRDIEQGLENMQRLPGVQADMEIVPGEQPGESDILITRKQDKYWRLGFSLDDSGTRSTGRYLGGITFSLDNPFSLSDLLYVSATHNFPHYGGKGSKNYTAHYSVPFGYWQFSVTASDYDYHQTVAGAVEDYQYSGESQNLGMQLSRVLHRNGTQKTVLTYDVQARRSRNYINDTEIQVQRRQTAAWRLGLQHRHYISQATLDAGVSWQRGTRWFGAQPAPEEIFGEATALSKILQMNASFKPVSELSETEKQTVSTLATVAAGLAGGLVGDSGASAVAGAQSGKTTVENNALSFGDGFESNAAAATSWNKYAVDNNLTPEQTQAGLDKIAKGDMPDSTNITKVIVDGYQDGVMIAGAWYLGPAASAGKVLGGGLLGLAANSGYQIYDLNQPQNANKSWDYLGSATSFTTGMMAPDRGVLANTGIAMGGAFFTDGPNTASLAGAGIGAGLGGAFGKYAPTAVGKILGNDPVPGFIYELGGGAVSEFTNGIIKDFNNPQAPEKKENK